MSHRDRRNHPPSGLAERATGTRGNHRLERADAVIAGDGIVALAAAVALRAALGAQARIVIVAIPAPLVPDPRAYAIAGSGRRVLARLGVWQALDTDAQPMKHIVVSDSRLEDVVRPAFLSFLGDGPSFLGDAPGDGASGDAFAHMVSAEAMRKALLQATEAAHIETLPLRIEAISPESGQGRILLRAEGGRVIAACLLVAADGARSLCRELAGISWIGWEYAQLGLTTTIGHERDHHGRAYEHFLPGGPFAVLPLRGRRSSIVWAEDKHEAKRLLALDDQEVLAEVTRRVGHELGMLHLEGRLVGYPLSFGVARAFAAKRVALVGDAAHVIHPVAGQGLNLGLQDVAALAEAVSEAAHLGLDPGHPYALNFYQRARRFDTTAMAALTDGLVKLFSNDHLPLRALRDLGLSLVDRAPPVKRFLANRAAGP